MMVILKPSREKYLLGTNRRIDAFSKTVVLALNYLALCHWFQIFKLKLLLKSSESPGTDKISLELLLTEG
jgi:hypothetical protein